MVAITGVEVVESESLSWSYIYGTRFRLARATGYGGALRELQGMIVLDTNVLSALMQSRPASSNDILTRIYMPIR